MKVYALIPVFNRLADTQRVIKCLREQDYSPLEIVIIDDGSHDGTREYLMRQSDVTTLVGNGNLWWAGAVHKGLAHVLPMAKESDYVLLVNNDVVFGRDLISTLVRVSQQRGGAIVGTILRDVDDHATVHGLGPVIDVWGMRVWELYHTLSQEERSALKGTYDVDAISGRGTLYPVRAFKVGGRMHPWLLPHYYADYELAMRMRRHGFPLVVSTEAAVYSRNDFGVHRESKSWFEQVFSRRSSQNIFRRAAFFCLVGTPRERMLAVPRMTLFALDRAVRSMVSRIALWRQLWLSVSWYRKWRVVPRQWSVSARRWVRGILSWSVLGRVIRRAKGVRGLHDLRRSGPR